jgi:hypothetical protein
MFQLQTEKPASSVSKVSSLPNFVTSLVVENATGGVVIMRGAVRVSSERETKFRLHVQRVPHLVRSRFFSNLNVLRSYAK